MRALSRKGRFQRGQYTIVAMMGCDSFAYVDGYMASERAQIAGHSQALSYMCRRRWRHTLVPVCTRRRETKGHVCENRSHDRVGGAAKGNVRTAAGDGIQNARTARQYEREGPGPKAISPNGQQPVGVLQNERARCLDAGYMHNQRVTQWPAFCLINPRAGLR